MKSESKGSAIKVTVLCVNVRTNFPGIPLDTIGMDTNYPFVFSSGGNCERFLC